MTTSDAHALDHAIDGRHDYFQAGTAKAKEYVSHVIRPALTDAMNDVKEKLLRQHDVDTAKASHIVHYTSLRSLFAMIHKGSESDAFSKATQADLRQSDYRFLRLYDSANVNDPSEGSYFLKQFTEAYDAVNVPAYIASFVTPDEAATTSATTRDNLVFWRHYGQDGRGCSIAIPSDRFADGRSALRLQAVAYGREKAEGGATKLRPVLGRLNPVIADAAADVELERHIAATILESLGEVPYLYKSNAYKYENECRIVALEKDFDDHGGIHHMFTHQSGDAGRLRMYGEHPCLSLTNILSTGSVITFGPAVSNVDNVQYVFESLLQSVGIEKLQIERSEIPYRRTN